MLGGGFGTMQVPFSYNPERFVHFITGFNKSNFGAYISLKIAV